MRAYVPKYEMHSAASLDEALAALADAPGEWTLFAGGTDLMVLFTAGALPPGRYLDIHRLRELRGVEQTSEHVVVGALTTYTDVRRSEALSRHFPSMGRAAGLTGGIAIQNRGTIGGNIANGSPAADTPPALIAYGAEVELVSTSGSRWVSYDTYHTGYKQSVRRPDELIARIRLPLPADGTRHYYRKVGTRSAQAISKIVLAGVARVDNGLLADVRVGVGSVAPTVVRCRGVETALVGRSLDSESIAAARRALESDVAPIDDIRSSAVYRLRVAGNVLEEFLGERMKDEG
jgi:CO/xanthine dehydrogenase FAD-binding subunit